MCIVFFTSTRTYSFVLASNRDEFLSRPTTRASWHSWSPPSIDRPSSRTSAARVLSGLDLEAGGTWLGLSTAPERDDDANQNTRTLRIATLTNFAETIVPRNPPRPSRGNLVKAFLDYEGRKSLQEYLDTIDEEKDEYAGYNLLVAELELPGPGRQPVPPVIGYSSNREPPTTKSRIVASSGTEVRGLSNATLEADPGQDPWPKVTSGCRTLKETIQEIEARDGTEQELVDKLWDALSTPSRSQITERGQLRNTILVRPLSMTPTAPLPATPPPIPPPSLSDSPSDLPITVTEGKREGQEGTRWYGTRTQTIILVERDTGRVVFREREAYKLQDGRPVWVGSEGQENIFEFTP
ncbi:uncharacterized protein JCM15063_000327 [Sporobolomyces koalae]|uniref:uncharacterized protein n=1 Tax=Sporobolomyces koalae TaxID=500713 RepID=UPI00317D22FC